MNETQTAASPQDDLRRPSLAKRITWSFSGGVIAAAVLYSGAWAMLASGLSEIATDWIDDQRAQGWAIAVDEPTTQGFPFWPEIDLTNISVTAPVEDGSWTWKAESLTLIPAGLNLTHLTLRAPGTHLISSPVATNGVWTIESARADFEINLDTKGKWQGAKIELDDTEIRDSFERPWIGATRFDADLFLASTAASTAAKADDVFATFKGAADEIRMGIRLGPFDRTVRAVRLEADLVGPIQPGRLSEALEAWRSGGGTVELRRVLLDWPPLAISGDGTLALDDQLQPIGALSTRITGFNETLDSLEGGGVIPRSQASSAQLILGLMAKTPRGGDTPELSIPLSVQNQRLSVGPFELLDVPVVRWE